MRKDDTAKAVATAADTVAKAASTAADTVAQAVSTAAKVASDGGEISFKHGKKHYENFIQKIKDTAPVWFLTLSVSGVLFSLLNFYLLSNITPIQRDIGEVKAAFTDMKNFVDDKVDRSNTTIQDFYNYKATDEELGKQILLRLDRIQTDIRDLRNVILVK